jgi:hypothetical protein
MADKILTDSLGKVWVDGTGAKILKTRPYEEETLTNGKVAEYVAGNFDTVLGYCKTWYDSIGTNHLIQNNASYQYKILNNKLIALDSVGAYNSYCNMTTSIANVKSCLIVLKTNLVGGSGKFLLNSTTSYILQIGNSTLSYHNATGVKTNMIDIPYGTYAWDSLGLTIGTDYAMMYVYSSTPFTFGGMGYRSAGNQSWDKEIVHITCYNKLLTNYELMYDYNALKARYNF